MWLYPRIIVSKSYENTSKHGIEWPFSSKTWTKVHWPLHGLWPHICWGHICVWLYPRINVSKFHGNTSIYVDTVINFAKLTKITTYYRLHTSYYILRAHHTTYRMSYHIVSFWTKFRRDKNWVPPSPPPPPRIHLRASINPWYQAHLIWSNVLQLTQELHIGNSHTFSFALQQSLIFSFVLGHNRPFQNRFWKLRKSYLHEVTWSFFKQSRKSSSPQNFINKSLLRPENSTIFNFSSAIKMKNTHIQSQAHYFWTTFKRDTYLKFNRKSTVSIWNDQNSLLSLRVSQTLQRHTTSLHLLEKSQKICSLALWWCFVCDPMCQIRKKSSLFGTLGHNLVFAMVWVKFVVACDYLNPAKGMVLRRAPQSSTSMELWLLMDLDLYASDIIGNSLYEKVYYT